jgi:ATP-dependent helicase/nuclease subunit B
MLNEYDKHRIFSLLSNNNIKSISFAKVSSEGELSISNLSMMYEQFEIIKINNIIGNESLSLPAHKLLFSELHDGYTKFNTQSEDLSRLNNSVNLESKVMVGTKGIDQIDEIGQVRLSASSLESFFSCEYRFYLERILKLNVANTYDWHLVIGNYIHYILEHVIDQDVIDLTCVRKYADEYITTSEREYTVEELFYLDKIIEQIVLIASIIDNQFNDCNVLGLEKSIDFEINKQFSFSGKIDKVLADRDNHLVIVDYKTGNSNLNFNHIKHGLGMQNMIYLYLMHQVDEQFQLAGTFRQNIKPKLINVTNFKTYEENYKVSGIIDKNQELFIEQNLSTLKCLIKKDGSFWSRSNVLVDQNDIRELEKIVIEKIDQAIDSISNNSFRINPKKNKEIDSCKYCKYQEICLKKDTTYQHI